MLKIIRHVIYYLEAYKLQNISWEGLKFYTEADIKEIPLVKLCCIYKNEEESEKGKMNCSLIFQGDMYLKMDFLCSP